MFSSKKNKLPPRPSLPSSEQILEDLNNVNISDIAFSILPNGKVFILTIDHGPINI